MKASHANITAQSTGLIANLLFWHVNDVQWRRYRENSMRTMTRRETLRQALAAGSLVALAKEWAMPMFAQDTSDVPFTDIPENFNPANPAAAVRMLDIRKIDGPITPKDQFFAMQHNNKPEIDANAY